MMAFPKLIIIIIFYNICLTRIGADFMNSCVDDVTLDVQLDTLLESNIQQKINELGTKDEIIKWMDDNIQERSSVIALLLNNLQTVHVKGSLEDKEQVHRAQARINELETQVANVSKETEKIRWKLERLKRINNEQKTIIRRTECALEVAEEEMIMAKTQETAFFRELIEVQESWLPHWLYVQWKEKGSPMLDPMFQKKAEFNKWAKPRIITVKTEMLKFTKPCVDQVVTIAKPQINSVDTLIKPYTKKLSRSCTQSFQTFTLYQLQFRTSTRAFLTDELTEALKIFLFLASAFMASQIIFRKSLDRPASNLQRINSHENVAVEDGYLERTGSGNYSGELFPKVKKRKIMSKTFDAKDHSNASTDNDCQSTKHKTEAAKTKRKEWITRSRRKRDKSAEHPIEDSEGSVKLREAGEKKAPRLEILIEEQLFHGNLMNKDDFILDPQIMTTNGGDIEHNMTLTEPLDICQVESEVVDKAMCPEEKLLPQKETLSSLFVLNRDKSPVVSGRKRGRWRFGKKKSTTSDERTKKEKKEKESKWCGQQRVCFLC